MITKSEFKYNERLILDETINFIHQFRGTKNAEYFTMQCRGQIKYYVLKTKYKYNS